MQNVSSIHFDDDNQDSFDDLDALFEQLERFEPPTDMVERIMDAVTKLPPHLFPQDSLDKEGPIIQHNNKQPS
jgi:hypothetical protein